MSQITAPSSSTAPPSMLQLAAMQIAAGGSAGFVEVCIMHPLDLVKTRLQLQTKLRTPLPMAATIAHTAAATRPMVVPATATAAVYYTGVADCIAKMYRLEGVGALWKGIVPPILAETPKRATKFVCFEQYKRFFLFGSERATPLTYSLAGFGAGVTEAIIVNPFEVVKVAMQANTALSKEAPTTWSVTRHIVRTGGVGLRGLNKGLTATIGRNGTFNMIYFGFYHSVKDLVPAYEDHTAEFLRKIAIGFTSGTIASIVNIPFDVAKSRIQGPQPIAGQIKYRTTLATMALVAREEGAAALYKGLLPKVMRLGPGGAIMLLVYEYAYEALQRRF